MCAVFVFIWSDVVFYFSFIIAKLARIKMSLLLVMLYRR